jgi:hypothetical protein
MNVFRSRLSGSQTCVKLVQLRLKMCSIRSLFWQRCAAMPFQDTTAFFSTNRVWRELGFRPACGAATSAVPQHSFHRSSSQSSMALILPTLSEAYLPCPLFCRALPESGEVSALVPHVRIQMPCDQGLGGSRWQVLWRSGIRLSPIKTPCLHLLTHYAAYPMYLVTSGRWLRLRSDGMYQMNQGGQLAHLGPPRVW